MTATTDSKVKPEIKSQVPPISSEEIMKRLVYNPTNLCWNNFQKSQPDPDRWMLIWCNLGNIAQNLFLTYRDSSGVYEMPQPSKRYPVRAWAYVDLPSVDEVHLNKIKSELETEAKEKSIKKQKS